jgi:hypothetical protein
MTLPVLSYHNYEETAFDSVPVLEGVVNDIAVFGILSLMRADGRKDQLPKEVFGNKIRAIKAIARSKSGPAVEGSMQVINYADAYLMVNSDSLAQYLSERRRILLSLPPEQPPKHVMKMPPLPAQEPKVIEPEPPAQPKLAPVVPSSPVSMTEILLQIAAMQTDFDIRLQVMASRLATLEAK